MFANRNSKRSYINLAAQQWVTGEVWTSRINDAVSSRKGNFKTPNPHSYNVTKFTGQIGHSFYTSYLSSGSPEYRIVGAIKNGWSGQFVTNTMPPKYQPVYDSYQDLQGRCMQKLYEKLNNGQVNLAVDLAESAVTLKMLKATLSFRKLATTFFEDLIMGKRDKLGRMGMRKRMDYVSGKWLEYRYGWNPMLHTIYDSLDMLRNYTFPEGGKPVQVRARSGCKRETMVKTGVGSYADPLTYNIMTGQNKMQIIANFDLRPGLRLTDFTSLNPAVISWELIPFSFVADWFVNVGAMLEEMENYYRFKDAFINGCITNLTCSVTKEERVGKDRFIPFGNIYPPANSGPRSVSIESMRRDIALNRAMLSALPMWYGRPRCKLTLSSNQQKDAISLIWQLFESKRKIIAGL